MTTDNVRIVSGRAWRERAERAEADLEALVRFLHVAEIRFGSQEQQDTCEHLMDRGLVTIAKARQADPPRSAQGAMSPPSMEG